MSKEIKLADATEEQIAQNIEMYQGDWGITFPAYNTQCTVEKNGDYLEVELEGVMNLKDPYYVNGIEANATLTIRLDNIDWDMEIEVE